RLLFDLLEKSPDDRPASALDVLHDIEPFAPADGIPVSASRSSGSPTTPRDQPVSEDAVASPRGRASDAGRPRTEPMPRSPRADSPARRAADQSATRPENNDTIALVERATEERQISTPRALLVVLVLSLVAGGVTYLVKSQRAAPPSPAASAGPAGRALGDP